jgi:voltage-gated potassium channel
MQDEQDLSGFDLFVLALSVVSVINLVWVVLPTRQAISDAVWIVDALISVVFLADFIVLYRRANDKSDYFMRRGGWLDLITCIPFPALKIARILRIVRVWRPMRAMGGGGLVRRIKQDLAQSALYLAVFLVIVVLQYGAMLMLWAESRSADANIESGSDAVWWAYVSVTTVGYGDQFPVTNTGRMVGFVVLAVGVGLFGVITGFLANSFLAPKKSSEPAPPPTDDTAARLEELTRTVATLTDRIEVLSRQASP